MGSTIWICTSLCGGYPAFPDKAGPGHEDGRADREGQGADSRHLGAGKGACIVAARKHAVIHAVMHADKMLHGMTEIS